MSSSHSFRWSHGEAKVLATAAMLDTCVFHLPSGPFSPFARAPWMGTVEDKAIVGHLRELGGDFIGIPFGIGRPLANAPAEWASLPSPPPAPPIHGPSGDDDWSITEAAADSVTLSLDYAAESPILRVERVVAGRPGEPAIDFTLRIYARHAASVSVGLHPNFRLPEQPGRLQLEAEFEFGLTHPGQTPPGQAQEFHDLSAVPQPAGRTIDMTRVPLSPRADRNMQLCGMKGPLTGTYLDEGAGFVLDWDRSLLQSLHIWHTDGGIGGEPWHNTYRAIGLEPLASAFDLHTSVSAGPNPINARGVSTSVAINPGAPLVIRHSVSAFAR